MLEEGGRGVGRGYSDETFVGGLSHQGRQGLFAMIVNQAMPGGKALTGMKSWFFSDDQVLCLGSDICCDEAQYATQTTICQKALRANADGGFVPTPVDGADFSSFPETRTLDETGPHWFLDVQQTGFYLPAGQRVTVARGHQESRDSWDEGDTEGDFLSAWIEHGLAPKGASYEYMLVVRGTPEAMERVAAEPPYRVIQRDQAAHIVRHSSGRWGCVFYVAQEVEADSADEQTFPISAVDRPCLAMGEAACDGRLDISVADPDLNLEADVNQPRPLRVSLRGDWRLQEATATVCAWQLPDVREDVRIVPSGSGETVLEILCRHGASYDLSLEG